MSSGSALPPIEDILPHRDPMLMLDRVLSFDTQTASAQYAPRSSAWYADVDGNMPAWIGVELMAQTVAAHNSLLRRNQGFSPKQGALLGTRRLSSTLSAYVADQPLVTHTRMIYRETSGMGAYECTIAVDGAIVARATLIVFEPNDFSTFVQASLS